MKKLFISMVCVLCFVGFTSMAVADSFIKQDIVTCDKKKGKGGKRQGGGWHGGGWPFGGF